MKKLCRLFLLTVGRGLFSFLFLPYEPIVRVFGKIERSQKIVVHYLFQLFRIAFGIGEIKRVRYIGQEGSL